MDAGRELDALVAEKVMGLQLVKAPKVWSSDDWMGSDAPTEIEALGIVNPTFKPGDWTPPFSTIPPYSTNEAAAWAVADHLRAQGWHVEVGSHRASRLDKNSWVVTFGRGVWNPYEEYWSESARMSAPTRAHAICLAALCAVGEPTS